MPIRAGRLRNRVTIQTSTESRSTHGDLERTWTTFKTVWASISPVTGREYIEGNAVQAQVSHRITFRHLDGVTPKMRILFGTRVFHVQHVANVDERGAELQALCLEDVG